MITIRIRLYSPKDIKYKIHWWIVNHQIKLRIIRYWKRYLIWRGKEKLRIIEPADKLPSYYYDEPSQLVFANNEKAEAKFNYESKWNAQFDTSVKL